MHPDRAGEQAVDEQGAGDAGEEHPRAGDAAAAVPRFAVQLPVAVAPVELPVFYLGFHPTVRLFAADSTLICPMLIACFADGDYTDFLFQ